MNTPQQLSEAFSKMIDEELKKLHDQKGEKFAQVAHCAFLATQIFGLIEVLFNSIGDNDFDQKVEAIFGAIGDIMGMILTYAAHGMTAEEIEDTKAFSERMISIQRSMLESSRAVVQ